MLLTRRMERAGLRPWASSPATIRSRPAAASARSHSAARQPADAASGLTDIGRLDQMLSCIEGRITHRMLDRISPLAVPVMLEIGREMVFGNEDDLLVDAEAMIAEATALV